MRKYLDGARGRIMAYVVVAFVAATALYQSNQAIKLARDVDHRGDIRACTQENLIRTQSNERNEKLEATARNLVEALEIISNADRPLGDDTNARLRITADQAKAIQTAFRPAKIADCEKAFPKP